MSEEGGEGEGVEELRSEKGREEGETRKLLQEQILVIYVCMWSHGEHT